MAKCSNGCPICGHKHVGRCSERILKMIDDADHRALMADDGDSLSDKYRARDRSVGTRISDGYFMEDLSGDDP